MTLSLLSEAKNRLLGKTVSMLDKRLPQRTKRLVFLASLTARLKGEDNLDSETLHKLNKTMQLATRDSSLLLPAHLNKIIWSSMSAHNSINEIAIQGDWSNTRIRRICQCVLLAMPCWLRYADDSDIARDVERLLKQHTVVFGV